MNDDIPSIKDVDYTEKTTFSTGAVRDIQSQKGRCDLMPIDVVSRMVCFDSCDKSDVVLNSVNQFLVKGNTDNLYSAIYDFCKNMDIDIIDMIFEVSLHFKAGAEKYGERNWEKGISISSFIDSGIRHYLHVLHGDNDERHDRAFVWNMMCAIWTCKHKPHLYDEFLSSVQSLSEK